MTDLADRFKTYMRWREARGASRDELALLREMAATLPQPEPAFSFPALLRELYPDPFTLAARRANQVFADMAEAIGKCSIKEAR